MSNRDRRLEECGLSLAEALVTLALLCIFIVPAIGMLRQSSASYNRAFADYQTDLALTGLLAQARNSVLANDGADLTVDFSGYADNDRFEYEVIWEEFQSGQTRVFRYPDDGGLDVRPAAVSQAGNFSGCITAASRDGQTGAVKVKTLTY